MHQICWIISQFPIHLTVQQGYTFESFCPFFLPSLAQPTSEIPILYPLHSLALYDVERPFSSRILNQKWWNSHPSSLLFVSSALLLPTVALTACPLTRRFRLHRVKLWTRWCRPRLRTWRKTPTRPSGRTLKTRPSAHQATASWWTASTAALLEEQSPSPRTRPCLDARRSSSRTTTADAYVTRARSMPVGVWSRLTSLAESARSDSGLCRSRESAWCARSTTLSGRQCASRWELSKQSKCFKERCRFDYGYVIV